MSLHIQRLEIIEFRGYIRLVLDSLSNLVLIVGPNAVGKTNIIEAIQLLTSAESFRKPSWEQTISWGSNKAHLSALLTDGNRRIENTLTVDKSLRHYEINGKKKSASTLRGMCPSVLFIPDNLQMIKAASSKRRDELDDIGCQLSKDYENLKMEYTKTLKQRNILIREKLVSGPLFDSWNDNLIVYGARLMVNRFRLFKRLTHHMCDIYTQLIPNEKLNACYIPSWQRFDEQGKQVGDITRLGDKDDDICWDIKQTTTHLDKCLKKITAAEVQRRMTLIGPHKDEIIFFIDGRNARMYASQGQQRSIVLVFKLATVALIEEIIGVKPILLLDDVMSEFDEAHRSALTRFIQSSVQTFITTTTVDHFDEEILSRAKLIKVPIKDTRHIY